MLQDGVKAEFFDVVAAETNWKHFGNLQATMDYFFGSDPFTGKRMLDIGGGDGVMSFYAAVSGAEEVVCLEPESAGSTSGIRGRFERMSAALNLQSVKLFPLTFQEYDAGETKFDVVYLHNSVNHLDEEACMRLQESEEARSVYINIFRAVNNILKPGGKLIMADCSRYNFFNHIRVRNPIVPTIEWHKHQSPAFWASLAEQAGFEKVSTRWKSFGRLGQLGRALLGNKVMSYFLYSHFCLTMKKRP